MFDHDDIAARQAAQARHMTERLNALAERVFVQAEAATEPEPLQAAALVVERLYRGVRLCMGYEARVVRDHRRNTRELQADTAQARDAARTERAARLKERVGRTVVSTFGTDREGEAPSEDDLYKLNGLLAIVVQAVDAARADLDPDADFDAEVAQLLATLPLLFRMGEVAGPAEPPPRRTRWRGSG